MPTPISPTPASPVVTDPAPVTEPAARNKADSDMFLNLLVAQMRYQNPLEPMKGTEFIAQSAQLATVEALQSIQTAQQQSASWAQMQTAHAMMGLFVDAKDISGNDVTGQVLGVKSGVSGATLTLIGEDGNRFDVPADSVTESRLPIINDTPTPPAAGERAGSDTPATAPTGSDPQPVTT